MQSRGQNVQAIPWVRDRFDPITIQVTAAACAQPTTCILSKALPPALLQLLINVLILPDIGIGSSALKGKGAGGKACAFLCYEAVLLVELH